MTNDNKTDEKNNQMRRERKRRKRSRGKLPRFTVLLAVVALLLCALCAATFAKEGMSITVKDNGNAPKKTVQSVSQSIKLPVQQKVKSAETPAPAVNADTDLLLLVNPWNKLPQDYEVKQVQLKNGQVVDTRCYADLQQMMDDCRANGLSPLICSSYRTQTKQQTLFTNNVNKLKAKGYTQQQAEEETAKCIAVPGTSEHQLGLAVDIVDVNNQSLNASQEETEVQKWLMGNSWKYGFILRYPSDKSEITGIIYEPWHYRYVGKEAAEYIYENKMCLEEYLL